VRKEDGKKLFTGEEIRKLLKLANVRMKALIYLGVNAAIGNTDVSNLYISEFDLKGHILDSPRGTTHEERRCILWPETVKAITDVIASNPVAADKKNDRLLFLTDTGLPLVRVDPNIGETGSRIDYVSLWFGKLVERAGSVQKGRNFYALRHTFYTIAGQTTDVQAVSRTAGHKLGGMADTYCPTITDDRLKRVSDYVRQQVLGVQKANKKVITVSSL
jgi:integrase